MPPHMPILDAELPSLHTTHPYYYDSALTNYGHTSPGTYFRKICPLTTDHQQNCSPFLITEEQSIQNCIRVTVNFAKVPLSLVLAVVGCHFCHTDDFLVPVEGQGLAFFNNSFVFFMSTPTLWLDKDKFWPNICYGDNNWYTDPIGAAGIQAVYHGGQMQNIVQELFWLYFRMVII